MDIVFSVPYIIRIIVSLFAILLVQKATRRLDAGMLGGILILAVWTGHSPAAIRDIALARVFSPDMFSLAFVIAGVLWLSSLMSHAGVMKELVVCLKSRLSKRAIMAALPAVVGLLPMPGGALFSCPLVDDADDANAVDADLKTQINYWFRHIWEFWWPLYPGLLLAVSISGLPIWRFALLTFPLFLAAIAAGHLFLLRKVSQGKPAVRDENGKSFFSLILPILCVIAVYALLQAALPSLGRANKYLPMAIGIVCGLLVLHIQHPAPGRVWLCTILSPKTLALVLLIVLIRVYGAFIEAGLADGSLLMEHVRRELDAFNIPALALVVLIPFISGLTTGITVGYIGASFPVVLSLAEPGTAGLYATIILGYGSGFIGMMLSPIHICLIVTNEYFKTSLSASLYALAKPAALLFIFAAAYSCLWRWM